MIKVKAHIPNMFTFFNLTLGILAIISILGEAYAISALLILLAAFMDRFDGKLARKFDAESELGKELDSLCDLISFGVAPAILIWSYQLSDIGIIGLGIIVLFAICGAYRLARFNIIEFEGFYMGIPITLCGGIVALLTLYAINYNTSIYFTGIIMLFLSYSMISKRIKLKKR
ncbi:CDP-diacylglycerol--serine O-phosphatidyltransferase [Alkaliphilus peptidifermentans]|uniref:CDP-diacylglycerol--serine O-phosphatidyltransferase n=1 Tax=Alkaliphilus peptidifermentans DSM 18978 TaxID=1120976 RepID=A0A1G5EJ49_9FIRM|nr:CDP-diacylglycerol--serine O-phosphatidyltransferase [Alkaliphilus peptidifermentans]SCY26986.1 CDP-diacylglycerol--serine O-phosphatidyltransferase [Alkaliphilus peptidifermentans DSM 18978]